MYIYIYIERERERERRTFDVFMAERDRLTNPSRPCLRRCFVHPIGASSSQLADKI